ncbi:MAG: hypothetical protein IJN52_01880 [Bacteroidales bacterium]|nr:hypothetical protein [Bacteroidales bacterium]
MPDYLEQVVVAVGFFDDDVALGQGQMEAGEAGRVVVGFVCAVGSGCIVGLGGDVSVAEEFYREFFERCFGCFPEGAVEFVIHGTFVNA